MSRHEGVSCDACNKSNFRGRRYKCLVCFDYDLCAACYENGTTSPRHSESHPMQCILTRVDFDLFYSGEAVQFDQPQAFTCPYCGKLGLTEAQLQEHVTNDHSCSSTEVICPVCAALPGGDPNNMTDDLGSHLTLEHRANRELDEPLTRNIRRIFHPRNPAPPRSRRGNPFASTAANSTNSPSATFSSARESIDPIAELLSQLSGVRRAAQQQSAAATASQLQLLQQQLQFERQQVQQARERLERLPRKQATAASSTITSSGKDSHASSQKEQFLLPKYFEGLASKTESDEEKRERISREKFTQELFFSLISPELETADTKSDSQKSESQANSSPSGTNSENADRDVQRKLDELDFHCIDSAGGECSQEHCSAIADGESAQEQCSAIATVAECANVVVTKVCSDIESDALYTGQSDSDTSVS